MEFLLGRYESKNEIKEIKDFKKAFFQVVDDFVPVFSGVNVECKGLFERFRSAVKELGYPNNIEVIEKELYDKTVLTVEITQNFKYEIVLVEHEDKGEFIYLERCMVNDEKVLNEDVKALINLFRKAS